MPESSLLKTLLPVRYYPTDSLPQKNRRKLSMTYMNFLKQQIADLFLIVFVMSTTYAISTYYGFRNPIELTYGFFGALVGASLSYILVGSSFRYLAYKRGL
ncbi:hypothetical protein CVU75_01070 [Candidatus Dependentiae bacterium HGW-Dependentiae-1]|nr:MAG: hypothetical protein CVU75_01070 [Candidatus Dependentiae bacterium HGW-Dependentiae-1]